MYAIRSYYVTAVYYFPYEEPVFRPPSEAASLILQPTVGCSQNRCRFCGMYKMKRFRIRPVEELLRDIASVPAAHRGYIQRVFLGDGDGLIYPQAGLVTILDDLAATFPVITSYSIHYTKLYDGVRAEVGFEAVGGDGVPDLCCPPGGLRADAGRGGWLV